MHNEHPGGNSKHRRVAVLRPHQTLSKYEMDYIGLLRDEFDLTIFTVGDPAIGGDPPGVERLEWLDQWSTSSGRRSFLNGFYARVLGRRYHLPGLGARLGAFDLVQANEAASECSWQAAKIKQRHGFRLLLSASENEPILDSRSPTARRRITEVVAATDHAFAISRQAKERLEEIGLSANQITLLGHGVDCDRFCPGAEMEPRSRDAARVVRVGYCGRFRREKGLPHLLAATRNLNVDLVLLGNGPDAEMLRREAGPRVQFLPPLPYEQIHEFYREVDIFVLPSIPVRGMVEQFGCVLIEAMASGVPIIASSIGGIPEVVGDAAVLVPPGDEPALKHAIEQLSMNPDRRRELGARGRRRVLAHYRREDIANRIRSVWRELPAPGDVGGG